MNVCEVFDGEKLMEIWSPSDKVEQIKDVYFSFINFAHQSSFVLKFLQDFSWLLWKNLQYRDAFAPAPVH